MDPVATIERIKQEFKALQRLRDAGYGPAVTNAKLGDIRKAVASLPPEVRDDVTKLFAERAKDVEIRQEIASKEAALASQAAELDELKRALAARGAS